MGGGPAGSRLLTDTRWGLPGPGLGSRELWGSVSFSVWFSWKTSDVRYTKNRKKGKWERASRTPGDQPSNPAVCLSPRPARVSVTGHACFVEPGVRSARD